MYSAKLKFKSIGVEEPIFLYMIATKSLLFHGAQLPQIHLLEPEKKSHFSYTE
jgi:hypothetical protein